jgi:hypothetical protein
MLGRQKKYEYSWDAQPTYVYKNSKPKRSLGRKLAIVFSFVFILAITPPLLMAISNIDLKPAPKVSVVNDATIDTAPKEYPVTVEEPKKSDVNQVEIINNDSYWKISKRACGTGKFYLSIQSQNGSKALYKGDFAVANCVL